MHRSPLQLLPVLSLPAVSARTQRASAAGTGCGFLPPGLPAASVGTSCLAENRPVCPVLCSWPALHKRAEWVSDHECGGFSLGGNLNS